MPVPSIFWQGIGREPYSLKIDTPEAGDLYGEGRRIMITKIDHVGIVVRDIDETLKVFSNIFGFEVVESITGPQQEFRSVLISKGNVSLELIEPINPEGSIANFLKQRGEGLHHIALDVDDIEQELESLQAKSVSLVNEEPESMLSARIVFVHPRSTAGVLIELRQKV